MEWRSLDELYLANGFPFYNEHGGRVKPHPARIAFLIWTVGA